MSYDSRDTNDKKAGAGCTLVLVALSGLGLRACVQGNAEDTREGYSATATRLHEVLEKHTIISNQTAPKTSELKDAVKNAEEALVCYADLLTVYLPWQRTPFINCYEQASAKADSLMDKEEVRDLKPYQEAASIAENMRSTLSNTLDNTRETLQSVQRDGIYSSNPEVEHYITSLVPKLDILASRMKAGELMVSNNVLHHQTKFQGFAKLIGRTEYFDEAWAELRALEGCLK